MFYERTELNLCFSLIRTLNFGLCASCWQWNGTNLQMLCLTTVSCFAWVEWKLAAVDIPNNNDKFGTALNMKFYV